MARTLLSADEKAWLTREIPLHTIRETSEVFAAEFGREIPIATVKNFQHRSALPFVHVDRKSFNSHKDTIWKPERDEFFREFVPGHSENEIRAAFLERFGIELTESQIANRKVRLGVRSGTHGGCFRKGQKPINAGKTWDEFMSPEGQRRVRESGNQFRRGHLPWTTRPLLDERVTKDGYVEIHVGQLRVSKANDQWISKARYVYEREHGELPDGMMVVFANGNIRDFSPGNLVAMTKGQHAIICHEHIPYHDAETLRTAMAIADVEHAAASATKRPRRCKACGRLFTPEYGHQARCRECIDAKISAPRRTHERKER